MNDYPTQYKKLREVIQSIGHGKIELYVQNGLPVRVEQAVKSIKLEG